MYGYVNGDPVNFSDPFGLSCEPRGSLLCQVGLEVARKTKALHDAGEAVGKAGLELSGVNDLERAIRDGEVVGGAAALAGMLPVGKALKVVERLVGETGNFKHAVKALGLDKHGASKELHEMKKAAGLKGGDDVWINTTTGDVRAKATGESIGNLIP